MNGANEGKASGAANDASVRLPPAALLMGTLKASILYLALFASEKTSSMVIRENISRNRGHKAPRLIGEKDT